MQECGISPWSVGNYIASSHSVLLKMYYFATVMHIMVATNMALHVLTSIDCCSP